jgi:hypothetical protein
MLEFGIPNNKKFKEGFENYKNNNKIDNNYKGNYVFKNSKKYMFYSTIFFLLIIIVSVIGIYDLVMVLKKIDYRIVLYLGLFIYGVYGFIKIYTHKITIENNNIIYKNQKINIADIESATVKIMKISTNKLDRCLVVKYQDKQYVYRLNLDNVYKFLNIINCYIGNKFSIEVLND